MSFWKTLLKRNVKEIDAIEQELSNILPTQEKTLTFKDLYLKHGNLDHTIFPGFLLESFNDATNWTKESAAGTITEEVGIVKYGGKSVKITTDSADAFFDKIENYTVQGDGNIKIWLYVEELTGISSVAFYLTSQVDYSKFFAREIQGNVLHEGWNVIDISSSEWFVFGEESWDNTFVKMRIRINCTAGTPCIIFDSVFSDVKQRPKCLITFDDNWESSYTKGFLYMQTKGIRGTNYVIGGKVDTLGYTTLAQIKEMHDNGWGIGTHGEVNLLTLSTLEEQKEEILLNENFLINNDLTGAEKHYAYPEGACNDISLQALEELNYLTARTIIDRNQGNSLDEPYLITRIGIYNTTTVEQAKGFIDLAIAQGSTIILNFHIIVDSDADVDTKILTSTFNEIIDYLALKVEEDLIDAVTIDEWYKGLFGYIRM